MGLNHSRGNTYSHKGVTWPTAPLEGRLQKLAEMSPNYQGGCVAGSYCPIYSAAEGALPILST